jgi:hypothetical protein
VELIVNRWHRLPDDLHKRDCGMDSLGRPKRCLDATFLGNDKYAAQSVTTHFDTIGGAGISWASTFIKPMDLRERMQP